MARGGAACRPEAISLVHEGETICYVLYKTKEILTLGMHTLSTPSIVIPAKRAQASACRDPWRGRASSPTMDPRHKPESDSLGVWRRWRVLPSPENHP